MRYKEHRYGSKWLIFVAPSHLVYTNRVVSMLAARLVGAKMIRSTLLARILRLTLNQTSVLLIVDELVIV
jgi:hypothetical protein